MLVLGGGDRGEVSRLAVDSVAWHDGQGPTRSRSSRTSCSRSGRSSMSMIIQIGCSVTAPQSPQVPGAGNAQLFGMPIATRTPGPACAAAPAVWAPTARPRRWRKSGLPQPARSPLLAGSPLLARPPLSASILQGLTVGRSRGCGGGGRRRVWGSVEDGRRLIIDDVVPPEFRPPTRRTRRGLTGPGDFRVVRRSVVCHIVLQ